jgi:hypothetical protein
MKNTWKTSMPYCIKNNKAFTLMNDGKGFFLITIRGSCQVIIDIEKTKKYFLKGKFERDVAPSVLLSEELYDIVL